LAFQRLGDARQADGDVARGAGGAACRVEAVRVAPDGLEALADFRLGKVVELDAVAARIGKGRVAAAGAGEFGVELDDVADIEHHQEGRPAFVGGQVAGVVFGLAAGAQHGVVEHAACGTGADFLGFADEAAALVAVDETVAGATVAVVKDDAALEDVRIVASVFVGRLGFVDFQQVAEVGDEELVIGTFGAAGMAPAAEELVDLHDRILTCQGLWRLGLQRLTEGVWRNQGLMQAEICSLPPVPQGVTAPLTGWGVPSSSIWAARVSQKVTPDWSSLRRSSQPRWAAG